MQKAAKQVKPRRIQARNAIFSSIGAQQIELTVGIYYLKVFRRECVPRLVHSKLRDSCYELIVIVKLCASCHYGDPNLEGGAGHFQKVTFKSFKVQQLAF